MADRRTSDVSLAISVCVIPTMLTFLLLPILLSTATAILLWPDSQIPYTIHPDVNRSVIVPALALWESRTCIRFRDLDRYSADGYAANQGTSLEFIPATGCFSHIGYRPSRPTQHIGISPSCASLGVVTHEIGHALGLDHTHARADRDQYVWVSTRHVRAGYEDDFSVRERGPLDSGPYEYASIMHYGAATFSRPHLHSLRPLDVHFASTIGQRDTLAFYDVKAVNDAYCQERCPLQQSCLNRGYPDPTDCKKCICPSGFGGTICHSVRTPPECPPPDLISHSFWKTLRFEGNNTCIWRIRTSPRRHVEFSLSSLHLLTSRAPVCSHEYVELKYGEDIALGGARFCHSGNEQPLLTASNQLIVIFHGKGGRFELVYRTAESRRERRRPREHRIAMSRRTRVWRAGEVRTQPRPLSYRHRRTTTA